MLVFSGQRKFQCPSVSTGNQMLHPPPQTKAPRAVTGGASTPFALRAQGDLPPRPTSVPARQLYRQYVWERRGGGLELNHCVINMCGWEVTGARQACKHLQLARAGLVNSSGGTKEAG